MHCVHAGVSPEAWGLTQSCSVLGAPQNYQTALFLRFQVPSFKAFHLFRWLQKLAAILKPHRVPRRQNFEARRLRSPSKATKWSTRFEALRFTSYRGLTRCSSFEMRRLKHFPASEGNHWMVPRMIENIRTQQGLPHSCALSNIVPIFLRPWRSQLVPNSDQLHTISCMLAIWWLPYLSIFVTCPRPNQDS